MKKIGSFLLTLFFLLATVSPGFGAWSHTIGHVNLNFDKTSSNSIGVLWTDTLGDDPVMFLCVASNNISDTDGATNTHTSITDPRGNTWNKAIEFTNSQGSAGNGAAVSLWYSKLDTFYEVGDVVTANFSDNVAAKAIVIFEANASVSPTVTAPNTTSRQDDGADPGSLDLTTLNEEHLWVRCIAHEGPEDATTYSKTAAYDRTLCCAGTTGAGAASNMAVTGEFDIFTGTSNPSDPTWSGSRDNASVLGAFKEVAGAADTVPCTNMNLLGVGGGCV